MQQMQVIKVTPVALLPPPPHYGLLEGTIDVFLLLYLLAWSPAHTERPMHGNGGDGEGGCDNHSGSGGTNNGVGVGGHDFGCSCLFKEQSLEFSSQSGPRSVNRENKSFWLRGRLCWKVRQPQQDQNCTWLSLGQKEKKRGNTQLTVSEVRGGDPGPGNECF